MKASSFGKTVKQKRTELKISQRDLAQKVGINFTYLSKIENDEMAPPAEDKIYLLAEHLGLNPDDLFSLARRVPEDLAELTLRPNVPQILRSMKDLSKEEIQDMLEWVNRKKASK